MSAYSFVAGLHDLLTFTAYETVKKPTFGQQYGWFIQTIVYGIIGAILLYGAEYYRKEAGEKRSTIPSVLFPVGAFMLLATFLLFVSGFHAFMHLEDYSDYRQSLAWVIETFIFGILSYCLLKVSENVRRKEGFAKSIFSFPSATLGVFFTIITLGVYIFSSLDYIYREYGAKDLNWLIESIVFAALAIIFSKIGDDLSLKDGEEASGLQTSLYLAGVVLLLPAVLLFLAGFNEFLYSDSPTLKWFYEFLLLFIPGAIAFVVAERTRRAKRMLAEEKQPDKSRIRRKTE